MKEMKKLAVSAVAGFVLASAFSTSAFADWRSPDETSRDDRRNDERRDQSYRDNEKVTVEGRITNLTRDRDGYRVQLERSNAAFWVPEHALRSRRNDFRVGVSIRLGGIFNRGRVNVDVVAWPGGGGYRNDGYRNGYVRGVIDRIDYRRSQIYLRDESSGRYISVDMHRADSRARSIDLNDLRRGDYVEISGDWSRSGVFAADRIDNVRSGRRGRY